ncbi:methyltransferase domain-containing protein [Candidatus Peregrinibacteria bacterium]|nr:methyltransferase domain-containing protein [Candidatus Peregrinibacteria bacterium]
MIELQLKLLGDDLRNKAFYDALKKVIIKGKTVVADIGSGTGFLSFLASRLGAKECYLYEYDEELLKLSREIAAINNIKNCKFFATHCVEIKKPVRADVVISETLGNYALEENIIENMRDAKRFLKPGGIIIPQKIEQFAAPIASPRLIDKISTWKNVGFGLNLNLLAHAALNNMFVYKILPADLPRWAGQKNAVQKWDHVDLRENEKSIRAGRAQWKAEKDCTIFGFAVWWNCELIPGITLSTSPFSKPTHWEQIFLPLLKPLNLKKGETLNLSIKSDSRREIGIRLNWEANGIKMDTF